MKLPYFQLDAFANQLFSGNQAGVVLLKDWIDTELMQNIAANNNIAETAFVVPVNNGYEIRWFTPTVEVDLCGHATLASASVLFEQVDATVKQINFHSIRSGALSVKQLNNSLELDFPKDELAKSADPICTNTLIGLGTSPNECYKGKTDTMLVFDNQEQIEALAPDFAYLSKIGGRGVIVTAPGNDYDYVYRFFAPQSGINEDPATGSAQTTLMPYWSEALGKAHLSSKQLSERGGFFNCSIHEDRVKIAGKAFLFLKGEISI